MFSGFKFNHLPQQRIIYPIIVQIFVMGLFNNCPDLICVLTTVSFKKKVLSFQNPGRLAIECRSKLIISECSVL